MTNSSEIIKLEKYLKKEDFETFLENIRKIADYNPETKSWKINLFKIQNIPLEEVKEIVRTLSSYVKIDEDYIIRLAQKEAKKCYIDNYLNMLGIDYEEIEPIRELVLIGKRYPRLRSILFLKKVIDYLRNKGIDVTFNRRILEVQMIREKGFLLVKPFAWDRELLQILKETCTLSYYIEQPVLGPDKSYMGSNIIERKSRAYRIDWSTKTFITYIAFYDELKRKLEDYGFIILTRMGNNRRIGYEVKENFVLLPHQEEAYRLWRKKNRGTIAIFTRGGKSFIGMKAIADLKEKTIIFVPTRELATTWKNYLIKYLGLKDPQIGLVGSGILNIRDITITIYNSGVKYLDRLQGNFELAIFDEAHHVPASTFKEVALRIDALHRLSLSATPKRRDNNERLLFKLSGQLVYSLGYKELLQLRIVAPIEVYDVYFAEGKEEKMKYLIGILERYKSSKTIIFTQFLNTAQEIYEKLLLQGYRSLIITGQTPDSRRKRYFEQFIKGKVNIMISTTVLDEGITVPDAEVAIIYENSGEARQLIQRIGRVIGYQPGKTAKIFEIVDVTNPREKYAYLRRKWVQELYNIPELKKYLELEKRGGETTRIYQPRLDFYDVNEKSI
ncbi:MAG: hypothetical protein B6U94_00300 [Thermofilum sp. ex4484_79]|nr:MAG: hypothetical protein B6U94_00300 [Thermofilum sp. ex4484_79]